MARAPPPQPPQPHVARLQQQTHAQNADLRTYALAPPPAFPFAYARPYAIQTAFMARLYEAIERRMVAVFESPTGTGKSQSILCGALKWLHDHAERVERMLRQAEDDGDDACAPGKENSPSSGSGSCLVDGKDCAVKDDDSDDEPDWVTAHIANRRKQERRSRIERYLAKKRMLEERLARARERDERVRQQRQLHQQQAKRKRVSLNKDDTSGADADAAFLLSEYESADEDHMKQRELSLDEKVRQALRDDHGDGPDRDDHGNAKRSCLSYDDDDDDDDGEDLALGEQFYEPKILFCSRTHSQLSQLVGELLKGPYARTTKVVALGSRQNLCVNPTVRRLGTLARMNDRCLDMQRESKASNKCPYLDKSLLPAFADLALASPRDIEDLASLGSRMQACAYYGSRDAIQHAQLVTLPYNLILQKSARESLGLSLKNNIVIFDEAHNIIDTISNIHTVSVDLACIVRAAEQLTMYLERYRQRLRGKNIIYIKQILILLDALRKGLSTPDINLPSSSTAAPKAVGADGNVKGKAAISAGTLTQKRSSADGTQQRPATMTTVNDFLHFLDIDHLNLFKIEQYLIKSRVAQKLNGFVLKQEDDAAKRREATVLVDSAGPSGGADNEDFTPRHVSALSIVQTFFMSLMNADVDGRVFIERGDSTHTAKYKYLLLNPSNVFADIVNEARAVILAGGTMEPHSEFTSQLFPQVPDTRILKFACGHVIPKENLLTLAIRSGPRGRDLEFKYDSRDDNGMVEELGLLVANFCNIIPDGVVIFFPSYAYLELVWRQWSANSTGRGTTPGAPAPGSVLDRISRRKVIFREPRLSSDVDKTLKEYADAVVMAGGCASSAGHASASLTGAMLFCVVGGKMSEGINFSDRLGRGVIMVGMPYPNLASAELREKMAFVKEKQGSPNAGVEYYENLCMRAVNQSIGRAIRHQGDYATILLIDKRYQREKTRRKLPGWIGRDVVNVDRFGVAVRQVAQFFRKKREEAHATDTA